MCVCILRLRKECLFQRGEAAWPKWEIPDKEADFSSYLRQLQSQAHTSQQGMSLLNQSGIVC